VAVTPSWSENSSFATISGSGSLSAGNVSADQSVTISASYGGKSDTHSVTIKYVPATLMGIAISGSTSLNEGTTAQYTCSATYSDGSSVAVPPTWSENSSYASISASGVLSAGDVSADQSVVITASFGGKSDTHSVTIKYVPPVLTGIVVSGSTSLNEGTTGQYVCTASYSDGTSKSIVPSWSENSAYASISALGILSADDVTSDQSVVITASFGGKSDTHSVTIKYVAPTLSGIVISGPAIIDEETSAQYVCTANYSDGTSETVTPAWSENSFYTTIGGSGLLTAADVSADQNITVTATYGGKSDTHAVVVNYVVPPVELTSITISGPGSMEENTTSQYVCMAHYSDGTSAEVSPVWSENSTFASIDGSGLLGAANVAADENVTVTARFDGQVDTQALVIMVMGDQVVFPLNGFDGKTVSAELWDDTTQTTIPLGEEFEPEEIVIENVKSNQWYWLGLREYDVTAGEWVLVHGRWIWM
jgi:preprotein translocase subunit Sss1